MYFDVGVSHVNDETGSFPAPDPEKNNRLTLNLIKHCATEDERRAGAKTVNEGLMLHLNNIKW